MINLFDNKEDCCGCSSCEQICPTRAITIQNDIYGFSYPKINDSLCVECHQCEAVCPIRNPINIRNEPKLYRAFAKSEKKRDRGSSGGVFGLIAEKVLSEGGVVYGAAFDDTLKLKHVEIQTIDELLPILKSKYLQSDLTNTFRKIKKYIKDGRKVLFCGTPCQCNALHNYMGKKENNNLIMIDFICHGVSSQKIFDASLSSWENKNNKRIKNFQFRHKSSKDTTEAGLRHWRLETIDNEICSGRPLKFPYYCGYLQYLFFRPSCYTCKFANTNRVTCLTLGDFWGLRNVENISIMEFNKGYSMLIVNSRQGMKLLNSINIEKKEYSLQIAIDNNYAYVHPAIQTEKSMQFFRDYLIMPWDRLEKKYLIVKTDIFHRSIRFIKRHFCNSKLCRHYRLHS